MSVGALPTIPTLTPKLKDMKEIKNKMTGFVGTELRKKVTDIFVYVEKNENKKEL